MNRCCTLLGAAVLGIAPGLGAVPLPGAGAATTALIVGGKGEYAHLTDEQISEAFGGYFAGYDTRVSVDFPGSRNFVQSVQIGATNLYADVYSTYAADPNGLITIGGVSEGAPSVTAVLQSLADDLANSPDTVPGPDQLNATVYGYPSEALRMGTDFQPFPETPYDLLYVFAQYDAIADFPDNPFNFLAVVNAVMGGELLHVSAANYPILSEETYWTTSTSTAGGTTTIVMIPTPVLPLLVPLQEAGASPETIAALDALLRPRIDKAYDRPPMTYGVLPETAWSDPPGYTPDATTVATAESTTTSAPAEEASETSAVESATPTTEVASARVASPTQALTVEVAEQDVQAGEGSVEISSPTADPSADDTAGVDEGQELNPGINPEANDVAPSNESADAHDDSSATQDSDGGDGGASAGSEKKRGGKHSAPRRFGHRK